MKVWSSESSAESTEQREQRHMPRMMTMPSREGDGQRQSTEQLADMKPKVNYKAGADIEAAVKGASLSWTTEAETDENTVSDDDNTGGNGGGNGNTPGGELEG